MAKSVYGNLICRGCGYAELAGGWYVCCYFLDTGKRRPCPGGKGCTVRKTEASSRRKRVMTEQAMAQMRIKKARDEERMALYRQGLSDRAIAQKLGLTSSTIRIWRVDQGLPTNIKTGRPRQDQQEELREQKAMEEARIQKEKEDARRAKDEARMELYRQGLSDMAIARRLGMSQNGIHKWRTARGLPPNGRSGIPRKEEQTNGESDTVREMRGADA